MVKTALQFVRAGDQNASAAWLSTFLPGARFLIRRRLGRADVEEEARSVLAVALDAAQADPSLTPEQLPGLIRGLIHQRFPAEPGSKEPIDSNRVKAARRVLKKMSRVERDALKRCYVLGETPESFLNSLKLTMEEFRQIQNRARAEFGATESKAVNVA